MLAESSLNDAAQQTKDLAARLYLIGRPAFDVDEFLSFLANGGESWDATVGATDAESLVEVAGRICYMSFGGRQKTRPNSAYVSNLIRQGHESVLEHVSWTFLLEGVSRAFTHQFVRHRVGFAFSQLSQQYHEETDATFVEPAAIRAIPDLSRTWRETVERCRDAYNYIATTLQKSDLLPRSIEQGREVLRALRAAARSVLPNATETKLVFTANARALRHFLAVRGGIVGDEEMRVVSHLILSRLKEEAPSLFRDFASKTLPDGLPLVELLAPSDAAGQGDLP
jgi:thymidylate synthase (FAD)